MSKITSDDLERQFHLLRSAPEQYLAMAQELVRADPDKSDGYWARYQAYETLEKYDLALADLDKVLSLKPQWIVYECRGNVLRALGRYREALADFNRAEAIDPNDWNGGFGHLFRADCHARLGNEQAALEDCAALRDDHWTPGILGAPAGNRDQVLAAIRRLAARARGDAGLQLN
jgi:tetratricopeptide (TPR) repeat protein